MATNGYVANGGSTAGGKTLQRNHILTDILNNIKQFKESHPFVNYTALKSEVLEPVLREDFDPETQIRGFLRTLQGTPAFQEAFDKLGSDQLKSQIKAFVDGASSTEAVGRDGFSVSQHPSPGTKHHFSLLASIEDLIAKWLSIRDDVQEALHGVELHRYLKHLPIIYEDQQQKKIMEVYADLEFKNWGLSVENSPRYTFFPTTVLGLQNVVQYARDKHLRIRCAGYRHSWSSIFSEDGAILVSFVNLITVTQTPDPMSLDINDPNTGLELHSIELKEETKDGKRLCRVGCAVTAEEFRRWAVANNTHAMPVDVILVEVTVGGTNAPICHGAGRRHPTFSDFARKIEYVDCHGKLQIVDDPELLRAASGAFGLLGIVTHITLELDPMSVAVLEPRKVDIGLAIPPLALDDIPAPLRAEWTQAADASQQLEKARSDFEHRAENDYYSEWFWFTYQQKAWVNTWNPRPLSSPTERVPEYPDAAQVFLQWIEGWLGGVLSAHPLFQALPGQWQAQLLATGGMAVLPPMFGENASPSLETPLPDGLHFRRGVQNSRVRDMEMEIPIPGKKVTGADGASTHEVADWDVVRRAWWDVIRLVYAYQDDHVGIYGDPSCPMRLTLEMRITGSSEVILAPQRGHRFGTASIEVLTVPDAVADGVWTDFCQRVVDLWTGYRDGEGRELMVRPHWAKEWEDVKFRGKDARSYLKTEAYAGQIDEWKTTVMRIGKMQGWGLGDLKERFSNKLWDEIMFDD